MIVMQPDGSARKIRMGILGLDTSHVGAFTKIINSPQADGELARLQVVAGFPGGNPAFPLSRDRLASFTHEISDLGVEIVHSIPALLERVDVVMLASVDGCQHLEQAIPVFEAGKPVFIDKPLAGSLEDALAISELAKRHKVPWFSSSASRFTPGYLALRDDQERVGRVLGCDVYSQSQVAPGHPDLFWYSIHGIELLVAIMGAGCQSVSMKQTPLTESVRGIWDNGRIGTYRSIREQTGKAGVGATVFGDRGIVHHNQFYEYAPLCRELAKFFVTRVTPVPHAETLAIIAFMTAANESQVRGGQEVTIAEVMNSATERMRKKWTAWRN